MIEPTVLRLALFVRSFGGGGGGERVMLNLAHAFADHGHHVDLIMARVAGRFLDQIPEAVNLVDLGIRSALQMLPALLRAPGLVMSLVPVLLRPDAPFVLGAVPALARYLRHARPDAMLSALNYTNITALLAQRVSGVDTPTVISVHNHLTASLVHATKPRIKVVHRLMQRYSPLADGVVAVSGGLADDLARVVGLPRAAITTIHNPVVTPAIARGARIASPHSWFSESAPPVIVGAGKLKPQKDFPTLVRAFARVRRERAVRLIILGDGSGRTKLLNLARELDVAEDFEMPGFVANPFAYMARASAFVLSSAWEGFGNVLVEAMACGCPVVSTNCPSGPAEILDHGRYGPLVPVGDDRALAHAINFIIDQPPDAALLRARSTEFTAERAAERYLDVFMRIRTKP